MTVPEAEEQETLTKAAAMLEAIHFTKHKFNSLSRKSGLRNHVADCEQRKRVLLVDYEDSLFTHFTNYIRQTGATVTTLRHGFSEEVLDTECPGCFISWPW